MNGYKHILFATDLSEDSHLVARKALNMAQHYGARVTMLHVVESLPPYAVGYLGSINIEQELLEKAQEDLAALAKEINVPAPEQKVGIGSVKNVILENAAEGDVDLIIVGSHGRHGIGLLLGSTSTAVLHGAECDVLVIRCKE